MSGPLSTLGKGKRAPLPTGKRSLPFRAPTESEQDMFDQVRGEGGKAASAISHKHFMSCDRRPDHGPGPGRCRLRPDEADGCAQASVRQRSDELHDAEARRSRAPAAGLPLLINLSSKDVKTKGPFIQPLLISPNVVFPSSFFFFPFAAAGQR